MRHELDDLKHIWQTTEAQPEDSELNLEAIQQRAAQQSTSLHRRFRVYLIAELLFTIVLLVGLGIWFFQTESPNFKRFIGIICGVLLPFLVFYYFAFQRIHTDIRLDQPIRDSLREAVEFWQRAIRIYFWGGAALMSVGMAAVYWIQHFELRTFHGWTPLMIWLVIWFVIIWALACLLSWWLTDRIYGRYKRRLQRLLMDLEGE
jgi:hypothetical protein